MKSPLFDQRWQQAAKAARRAVHLEDAEPQASWLAARVLAHMPASANEAWAQALTSISARFVLAFAGIFLAAGGWLSWQMSSVDLLTPDWLDAGLSLNLLLP